MRFIVVGTSGVGKSTFAQALAAAVAAPYIELDDLWWTPNWTPREMDDFRARVDGAVQADTWVVDGNYAVVRSIVWPRATHVVWLNFGRPTVFWRILARTVQRVFTREALWAGNRESFARSFFTRKSILVWSVTTFAKNRARYAALRDDPPYAHLQWHEFTSPAQARRFLLGCRPCT